MSRLLAALFLFLPAAMAGEKLSLAFRDGKTQDATVEACDADGVVADGRRIPWDDLTPVSAFAVRKALTPYDDGKARLELSGFARQLGLYEEAVAELEVALALQGVTEAEFEKARREIEEEEVDSLCAIIEGMLETGDHPAECLGAIRRLKERYPDHASNAVYQERIPALVAELERLQQEQKEAQEALKDDKKLAALRETVEKLQARKVAALRKGDEMRTVGLEAAAKGAISRAEKNLVEPSGAEKSYKAARGFLREIARADPTFRVTPKEEIQKEYDAIEKRLIDCYLACARMQMRQRNYKAAATYVRKVLLYDPIQEEALDMAEEIRRNRITFKVSDITNARPRVTGG